MWPKLMLSVCAWYFFNVRYNLANKMVLQSLDAVSVGWIQLVSGILVMAGMWACGLPTPSLNRYDILTLTPPSIFYAMGQFATQAALSNGNVSFTHVVKSLEPAVNALVSALVLRQCLHPVTYLALVPIVFGVYLTTTSWQYSTACAVLAMLSNVCFALRNVLAQKYGDVGQFGENPTTKKTNQLGVITILGSVLAMPFVLLTTRGFGSFWETWANATNAAIPPEHLLAWFTESCVFFSFYQVSSFWVLSLVQPISHSVLNSLKRVVVIMAAIVFLHEPVTRMGMFGVVLASLGAIMYSCAKIMLANADPEEKQQFWQQCRIKNKFAVFAVMFTCAAIVLFFESKSSWGASIRQTKNLHSIAMNVSPTVATTLDSRNFVLVPTPSFDACAGKVRHLTCLKMLLTSDLGVFRWDPNMSKPLCDKLLAGRQTVDQANVGLCVQHHGRVGAVAQLQYPLNASGATKFDKGVNSQDFQHVLDLLPRGGVRIVSRKTIHMSDVGRRPQELLNPLNFSNHEQTWQTAMAVNAVNGNLGNLIWRFGATHLVNPYTTSRMKSKGDLLPDALLEAAANLLYIPTNKNDTLPKKVENMTRNLVQLAEQLNVPSILIGIGLQAELPQNQDLEHAVDSMQMHELSVTLLKTFASRAPDAGFSVRGNITATMCRKAGILACVPIGCPSFTINRAKDLGSVLKHRWKGALQKSTTSFMRIAMHLPQMERGARFHEEVYKTLIRLYSQYDSMFVLQSDYDYPQLKSRLSKAGIHWDTSRVMFFTSVVDWLDQLKTVDFVIGSRIHGTMAAVAAGAACLILPTDFRTLEMAQAMNIPMIAGAELDELDAATFNLTATMEKVLSRFDFVEFEKTRRAAIRTYSDILAGMDIEIHPELLEVLNS